MKRRSPGNLFVASLMFFVLCVVGVWLSTFEQPVQAQSSGGKKGGAGGVTITNVAGLANVAGKVKGTVAVVTDGNSSSDCTVGGASTVVNCQYSGTTWAQLPASGAGGTAFSSVTGGTNAASLVEGTGGSISTSGSGTISATQSAALSVAGQTGLITLTGIASTSRIKTVRDAADTLLELGGSYTPTGTWTNMTFVNPALGTPASGVITNLTGTCAACTANSATTAVNLSGTPALPNGTTGTTQSAKSNDTKLATDAYVDRPTGLTTGTSVTLSAPRQYFICTSTCTITVPVPAAGDEFCVQNDVGVSTVITFAAIGSSSLYGKTDQSAYGTAGTGTLASGGAAGDKMCLLGKDATHYNVASFNGTWTAN